MTTYLLAPLLAFALTSAAIPLLRKIAFAADIVDRPDGSLKNHDNVTPYLGGLAIAVGALLGLGLTPGNQPSRWSMATAVIMLCTVGLIDDAVSLKKRYRVFAQFGATVLVLMTAESPALSGNVVLDYAAGALFIMAFTNAFNLLDIMNGLAAGIGLLISSGLFIYSSTLSLSSSGAIDVMLICLSASLLAYLPFNFPTARIFMGDAGSTVIGFLIGASSWVLLADESNTGLTKVLPVVIALFPLIETTFVSIKRITLGRSPFIGSPDHIPIRLAVWSQSKIVAVLISWIITFSTVSVGVASLYISEAGQYTAVSVLAVALSAMLVFAWRLRDSVVK